MNKIFFQQKKCDRRGGEENDMNIAQKLFRKNTILKLFSGTMYTFGAHIYGKLSI